MFWPNTLKKNEQDYLCFELLTNLIVHPWSEQHKGAKGENLMDGWMDGSSVSIAIWCDHMSRIVLRKLPEQIQLSQQLWASPADIKIGFYISKFSFTSHKLPSWLCVHVSFPSPPASRVSICCFGEDCELSAPGVALNLLPINLS